jgi:hypothetical protein
VMPPGRKCLPRNSHGVRICLSASLAAPCNRRPSPVTSERPHASSQPLVRSSSIPRPGLRRAALPARSSAGFPVPKKIPFGSEEGTNHGFRRAAPMAGLCSARRESGRNRNANPQGDAGGGFPHYRAARAPAGPCTNPRSGTLVFTEALRRSRRPVQ